MTVATFDKVQNIVDVGLPIITRLEEVILIAIEIDRADNGQLEIRLLQYQMTIMSARLVLVEASEGMKDYGEDWLTDERTDNLVETIEGIATVTNEMDEDESLSNLIDAADATYKEREGV